ncbi:MAG: tetratricopeptide repeat protein, partial [Prevotella sp.]|nr:tetratricopeptide repeat protein [Prevotella sp.]
YRAGSYDKAEVEYRKAADANSNNPQAMYNLGCALMQQQKDSAAIVEFESAGKAETNKLRRSKSYHNIGVICQGHQMFSEAIEAYKESLRLNPNDDETRYNLALCQRQQKKQQQDQNNQNNQNQDQNNDKDKQNKQDKQDKQNKKNNQDQQQQQQQPEQMSRENAEQLLEAAMRDEKDVQNKMQRRQAQPKNRRLQKNW